MEIGWELFSSLTPKLMCFLGGNGRNVVPVVGGASRTLELFFVPSQPAKTGERQNIEKPK